MNTVEIGAASAIEQLVSRENRLEGGGLIEVVNVPSVVLIDSEKVVRPHVAQVIGAENHSWAEFPAGRRYSFRVTGAFVSWDQACWSRRLRAPVAAAFRYSLGLVRSHLRAMPAGIASQMRLSGWRQLQWQRGCS